MIEIACGLVGQEQLGLDHHGSGHGHALLFSTGKLLAQRSGLLIQMKTPEHGPDPLFDDVLPKPFGIRGLQAVLDASTESERRSA